MPSPAFIPSCWLTPVLFVLENGTSAYGQPCSATLNPATGASSALTGVTSVTSRPFGAGYIFTVMLPAAAGTLIANVELRCPNSGESFGFGRPQLEAGVFATSYIPTGAAIVTRTADSLTIGGTNFSSIYNSAAGTLVVEAEQPSIFSLSRTAAGFWLDAANRIGVYRQSAGSINAWYNAPLASGQVAVAGTFWKAALAWSGTAIALSAKGAAVVTAVYAGSMAFTALAIGDNGSGGEVFCGHIKSISCFNTRLSDAQLQAVSA